MAERLSSGNANYTRPPGGLIAAGAMRLLRRR